VSARTVHARPATSDRAVPFTLAERMGQIDVAKADPYGSVTVAGEDAEDVED